jgi:hypothetical protein
LTIAIARNPCGKEKKKMPKDTQQIIEQAGYGFIERVEHILTVADLLAMPTPVQIIPAPAADEAIIPIYQSFAYKAGLTPYTLGNADNALSLRYHGGTIALVGMQAMAGFADQAASQIQTKLQGTDGIQAVAVIKGLGLDTALIGTAPALTLGDGTITVTLLYIRVKVA